MQLQIITTDYLQATKLKQEIGQRLPQHSVCIECDIVRYLTNLNRVRPQVIFIDLQECSPEVREAVIAKSKQSNTKIVHWYQKLDKETTLNLLGTGISYWIAQNTNLDRLPLLFNAIAIDDNYLCQKTLNYIIKLLTNAKTHKELTPQEQVVLEQLQLNYTYNAIAENLGISRSTVRSHVLNINNKLKTSKRHNLVRQAQTLQLI